MKYLLLGGAESVGKTETMYRTAQYLLSFGFTLFAGTIPTTSRDFTAVLNGNDKTGKTIYILLISATDTPVIIQDSVKFFKSLSITVDIIISSVRDDSYGVRRDFFRLMNINLTTDIVIEIPLAKITRQGGNFTTAIQWYRRTLDAVIVHSLSNQPFNI